MFLLMKPDDFQKSNRFRGELDNWDYENWEYEDKTCKQTDAGARTEKCSKTSCKTRGHL